MHRVGVLVLGLAALAASPAMARRGVAQAPLTVAVDEGAARVAVGGVLADESLRDATTSGLPLRLRFRIELWRDEFFDDLVRQVEWTRLLAYEPLERYYLAGPPGDSLVAVETYAQARRLLERDYRPRVRATEPGRYYYLVFLEVETLSLSDLDELEQWLRGEVQPAVRGRGSVPGAVGAGLKRLLIRVLDLPARRFEARSSTFRIR